MKLLNILSEIGEASIAPYPYDIKSNKTREEYGGSYTVTDWTGFFKTDSGDEVEVILPVENYSGEKELNVRYLTKTNGDDFTYELTGRGLRELFKLMSTIVDIIKRVVDEEKKTGTPVSVLSFSSSEVGTTNFEIDSKYKKKRDSLYLYYINKLIGSKKVEYDKWGGIKVYL